MSDTYLIVTINAVHGLHMIDIISIDNFTKANITMNFGNLIAIVIKILVVPQVAQDTVNTALISHIGKTARCHLILLRDVVTFVKQKY